MALSRALRSLAILAALLALGPSYAQAIRHDVTVSIPSTMRIRIVGAGDGARTIEFAYQEAVVAYLSASDDGVRLPPTSVNRFDDIEVSISGVGEWRMYVVATAFDYAGTGTGEGLNVGDIRVVRGSESGLTPGSVFLRWGIFSTYDRSWTLSTTPRRVASSLIGTFGWSSLGFNGSDYSLAVNGDEDAGSFTTSVTYFLTFP